MGIRYYVQFQSAVAARSSICCIPIAISKFRWGVVISATWSVMLCVVGGSADSGVCVRAIFMPSSCKCCSWLSAQQF